MYNFEYKRLILHLPEHRIGINCTPWNKRLLRILVHLLAQVKSCTSILLTCLSTLMVHLVTYCDSYLTFEMECINALTNNFNRNRILKISFLKLYVYSAYKLHQPTSRNKYKRITNIEKQRAAQGIYTYSRLREEAVSLECWYHLPGYTVSYIVRPQ